MIRTEFATAAGPVSALCWDRAGPHAPWLHFAHATGMNAQVYARLLEPLAGRFRMIASDARGHGLTRLPADPAALDSWQVFAADLDALLDAVAPDARWLLAGHSMGAAVSALVAAQLAQRAAGLVIIEPAMVPFALAPHYETARRAGNPPVSSIAEQAARRRPGFADAAEARAAYAGRGLFGSWADADLDAYLAGGLRGLPGGGVRLGCTPAYEAATFRAVTTGMEAALATLACPFALVAGDQGSTVQDADLAAIAAMPRCLSAVRLPGTTHFVPLEAPAAVRDAVLRIADAGWEPAAAFTAAAR